MGSPRAFLSSTYLDLRDIRDHVATFLEGRGFDVTRFERGGVFYDPALSLDESCYREVVGAHLFLLLIGGRYGSPSSTASRLGKKYTSVTRKELETAIQEGIPTLVFVRKEVDVEFRTYLVQPKSQREQIQYASVDDTQVFQLLEQVYQQKKGNPVFTYTDGSEVAEALDKQLSGLLARALEERRRVAKTAKVRLNGFKLFYYREQAGFTQKSLAAKTGISRNVISRLEKVDVNEKMTLGDHLFRSTTPEAIQEIERALKCPGALEVGQRDDFLSLFLHFYGIYKSRVGRRPNRNLSQQHEGLFPVKTLVLDFDGTLTKRSDDGLTTWERLWVAAGYGVNDCNELARKYVKNGQVTKADHKRWCKDTAEKFKQKLFTRRNMLEAARKIHLIRDVQATLERIHAAGISLYLISGSIKDIVRTVLGKTCDLFDEIHANHLVFNDKGQLTSIRGTNFDFQGKGEFIKGIIDKEDVSPLEVLFVGNSLNDIWASNAGVRTLCVNPHFTDPNDVRDWTYCIRHMHSFTEVLPYMNRPELK